MESADRISASKAIIERYGRLAADARAAGKAEVLSAEALTAGISTIQSHRAAAPKRRKSQDGPVRIVICGSELPDIKDIIREKRFHATFVVSGEGADEMAGAMAGCRKGLSVIGLQKYLFDQSIALSLNNSGAETLHLGEFRDNMRSCEPLMRESEYIFIDMRSVKYSDYPWNAEKGNPNGFTASEICHLARYAGFSCRLKGVFIFGTDDSAPGVCHNLTAQTIWHIVNGIASNIAENPNNMTQRKKAAGQFEHKIVTFDGGNYSINFLKSRVTGRLWFEIPVVKKNKNIFVPCSEADYQTACNGEVPNRWVFYYDKHNIL